MVGHDIQVMGAGIDGGSQPTPVLLQMSADDFPARFLQDVATQAQPAISSTVSVDQAPSQTQPPVLFQPVQRMLNVAMVQLNCNSLNYPRLDPTRIETAGLVIRRAYRQNGLDQTSVMQGWMRTPAGQFKWINLSGADECQDPEPVKRPQLQSGQAELDRQLAAFGLSSANTESYTPAFAAPPDTCANLNRTLVYALVPTASSEMSDAVPVAPPALDPTVLASNLPTLLQAGQHVAPLAGADVDYHWMSDDFLNAMFPPGTPPAAGQQIPINSSVGQFQMFSSALRVLRTAFNAFDGSPNGNNIVSILNRHIVITSVFPLSIQPMGEFYRTASASLLDYAPDNSGAPAPTVTLPYFWELLTPADQNDLMTAFNTVLSSRAQPTLTPTGRFQDPSRLYKVRMFFRIKGESSTCPADLVWSCYSEPFRIAAWYESSDRPTPPVVLPDPTDKNFMNSVKPNCSFVVPPGLMNAMQGTSMSGLMNGAGGGGNLTLSWICGFNIPIITICAFFVLSLFLILLNILFFWLPIVKICIPFPFTPETDS
jgi:hypothetical protein